MIKPFHLSFAVPDIEQAKEFYVDLLGCDIGRDNDNWVDILFFGHQVTVHQQNENMPAVAIDHFGPVLDKNEWLSISEKCAAEKVNFILAPSVKDEGTDTEEGKFIVNDPAGNVLEFKYYGSFDLTVAGRDT